MYIMLTSRGCLLNIVERHTRVSGQYHNDQGSLPGKIKVTCSNQVEDIKNIGDVCHKAAVDKNNLLKNIPVRPDAEPASNLLPLPRNEQDLAANTKTLEVEIRDVIRADRFEDGVDTTPAVTGEADFEPRFREMWASRAAVDSRQPHSLCRL